MTDTADLVATLLDRVQALEDKAAVHEVLTAYGPAVDAGDADAVGRLWTEDAVYDIDIRVMEGRDAITEMVRTAPHQDYLHEGCGRTCSIPYTSGSMATPRWRPAIRCCCAATPMRIRSGCGGSPPTASNSSAPTAHG